MFSMLLPNQKLAVAALLMINICGSISMDIHLPAAPSIQQEFGCSVFATQMVFVVSVALMALTPIFWGRYADIIGRQPLFIAVSALMTLGQFLCALSGSIEFLILSRIIQYFGHGGILALTIAILCELYDGKKRAQILALREMSVPLGLIMAPIIGGYTAMHLGWRYNFWALGIIQVFLIIVIALFMPKEKTTFSKGKKYQSFFTKEVFLKVFTNKNFLLYAILLAFTNAPYMVFITHSSFLYLSCWNVSAGFFVISHSLLAVLYFLSLFGFRFFLNHSTVERLVNLGMGLFCGFAISIILYYVGAITHSPLNLLLIMYFSCIASGFVIAGSTVLAMQSSANSLYGTYAAFLGMIESSVAAIFMGASSFYKGGTELSTLFYMTLSTMAAILIWGVLLKNGALKKQEH
jgi:DHA1 family bicyclomycin/chloramphenicol resistance-like MFS transporter